MEVMAVQKNSLYRSKRKGFTDLLNYAALVDEGIVLCKDGSLLTGWVFRGSDNESASAYELNAIAINVNKAFARFGSGWMMHTDEIRMPSPPYSQLSRSNFPDPVTRAIERERKAYFDAEGNSFESHFVLTMTFKPPLLAEAKFMDLMIDDSGNKTGKAAGTKKKSGGKDKIKARHEKIIDFFKNNVLEFQEALKYHIKLRPLSAITYTDDFGHSHVCEEILSHINRCITGLNHPVNLPPVPMYLDAMIGVQDVWAGTTPKVGEHYMIPIAINGFPAESYPSICAFLSTIDMAFRWNTRFIFIDSFEAEVHLNKYRRKWSQKVRGLWDQVFKTASGRYDQDSLQMVEQVDQAISDVKSGLVGYGYYTANIILMGADLTQLELKAKEVSSWINSQGFSSRIETVNAFEAFLGSLPGHGQENVRRPLLNTLNVSHLLPLSSVWAGDEHAPNPKLPPNSPPLIQTKTNGSEPFRLNLHVDDVGHTLILGPTGAGKSVLLNLIKAQFRRYRNAVIFDFDIGYSAYALTKAAGGVHFDIGSETGGLHFAPLSHIDPHNKNDVAWFANWITACLKLQQVQPTPAQKKLIYEATLSCLQNNSKTLSDFKTSVQDQQIKDAIEPYTVSGAMGDLLDAEEDGLSIANFTTFEIKALMELNEEFSLPVLLYVFWRIEKRLDGSPTMLVLDEAWLMLGSDAFRDKIKTWLKTLRKANCFVVMATQSISDAKQSGIVDVLKESCPSVIYLPNEKALEPDIMPFYQDMGMNEREILALSQKVKKRDYYYTSVKGKRWFELALGDIALSFTAVSDPKDIAAIRQLEEEYGQQWPQYWLRKRGIKTPVLQEL